MFCFSRPIADDSPTTAREKFGGQKAISSDMYFGRNDYDANSVREAQSRLQTFSGATAISSNQYFGRDDEDDADRGMDNNILGDGSLANLETAARDAYSKFMANPDVQNVGDNIRAGALKVTISSTALILLLIVLLLAVRLPCHNVGKQQPEIIVSLYCTFYRHLYSYLALSTTRTYWIHPVIYSHDSR